MSDTLRTRIAKIADAHAAMGYDNTYGPNDSWVCECGLVWAMTDGTHGEHLAGVLIRALLEPERDCYSWCSLSAGHEGDCW